MAAFLVVGLQLSLAASASADELFLPVAPPDGQTADAASVATTAEYQGATLRRRHARVDPGLLSEARATAGRGGNAEGLIDLNLFDDATFQVTGLKTGPFGATVLSCGSTVFAHELGHNMGLNHDRHAEDVAFEYGLGNKPTSYAYGYVNQAGFDSGSAAARRWRTTMAYSTQCSHAGVSGCSRVGRFSNPAQTRSGDPLGVWSNGNAVPSRARPTPA